MNEEQSKRLADAAEAIIQAAEALDDAREVANDRRFESELERERQAAGQLLSSRVDTAGKRVEEAVRRGAVVAATMSRPGGFARYREAATAAKEGRSLGRTIADQDGSAAKRSRAEEAMNRLTEALQMAAQMVFAE